MLDVMIYNKRRIIMRKKKFSVSQAPFLQFVGLHGFFTIPVFFFKLFEVSHHLTCLIYICSSVNKTLQDCFFLNFFYFSTPGVMQMLSSSSQTTYGDQKTITDYLWGARNRTKLSLTIMKKLNKYDSWWLLSTMCC